MNVFYSGDVLAITRAGHTRYVRVGGPHPTEPRIWIHDCDGAGQLIGHHGRYVTATTLASRYRPHARPIEKYTGKRTA